MILGLVPDTPPRQTSDGMALLAKVVPRNRIQLDSYLKEIKVVRNSLSVAPATEA
jgi:hypothetical protein